MPVSISSSPGTAPAVDKSEVFVPPSFLLKEIPNQIRDKIRKSSRLKKFIIKNPEFFGVCVSWQWDSNPQPADT